MSDMNAPTVFIKKSVESSKFFWILCLSENPKRPTCKSPTEYFELTKCRQSAMRFCKHLASKIKIKECDEVVIIDEVGDQRKLKSF